MISQETIGRINELAKKSKTVGLTDIEKEEQQRLRKEYIASFRQNFIGHLENIKFVEDVEEEVEKSKKVD